MAATNDVKKIYHQVVQDVCAAVREALSEEGYDEHTLNELRSMWSAKIDASKAVEPLVTSAVDDATTRNNRRINNSELNHSNVLNNRQATPTIRPNHLHTASVSAMTTVNLPFNSNQMTMVNPGTTFIRPQVINRPQLNTSTMGINPMTKPHQIDGTHDEIEPKRRRKAKKVRITLQLDGTGPTASDDDDDDDDNEAEGNDVPDDLDEDDDDDGNEEGQEDPNPLCSDDDISGDDEPAELFDTDNVVVCQYDKISRTKNKWRFTLKSGVMNINGRDYVFSKASGDADW